MPKVSCRMPDALTMVGLDESVVNTAVIAQNRPVGRVFLFAYQPLCILKRGMQQLVAFPSWNFCSQKLRISQL